MPKLGKRKRKEARKRAEALVSLVEHQSKFLTGLRTILKYFSRADYRADLEKFVPDLGLAFGTPLEALHIIGEELGKKLKKSPDDAFDILYSLWERESREERLITSHVLHKLVDVSPRRVEAFVWKEMGGIGNWEVCDALATKALGPLMVWKTNEMLKKIKKLIKDKDRWVRRLGILSLLSLAHQGAGFKRVEPVLKMLDPVMEDPEGDVKKAAAWVIRDFTPKSRQAVIRHLTRWVKGASMDTEWIIRNASTKLPKAERAKLLNIIRTTGKAYVT